MTQFKKIFAAQNTIYTAPYTIYAGTYPGALIIKSVNGGTKFTNEGTAGKGNPLAFCQLVNGDLVYTTDTGWVINHTKSISVKVSDYAIRTISFNSSAIYVGDDNGSTWQTEGVLDIEVEWLETVVSSGHIINNIIAYDDNVLMCLDNGIYSYVSLLQSGNFTCTCDVGGGVIYAGTNNGHIWKSINNGANWTDIIDDELGGPVLCIIYNAGRFIFIDGNILISDNNFSSIDIVHESFTTGSVIISSQGNVLLCGDALTGKILLSTNNGDTFTDLGQQFSQTSINCLISI
jgi:hypothetical protein